ncbi:30S ribosomal protein S4 [Nanoarchaeota archaeon]
MGDPRKQRAKFHGPQHPWQKERLDEENELVTEYGLKNKTEVYRISSLHRKFLSQTKKLSASKTDQSQKETEQFLTRLKSLGIIDTSSQLGDVLNTGMKDILERRLQTIVFRKDLAKSVKQARQFITHGHVIIAGKLITSPSYLVSKEEEGSISFIPRSALVDAEHPERVREEAAPKLKKKEGSEEEKSEDKKAPKEEVKKEKKEKKVEEPKEEKKEEAKPEEKPKEEPKTEEKKEEAKE